MISLGGVDLSVSLGAVSVLQRLHLSLFSQFPKAFAASLLDYVGSQAQYLHTLLAMSQSNKVESLQHAERLRWAEMALEALRNVIKNNPGERNVLECDLCLILHPFFLSPFLPSFLSGKIGKGLNRQTHDLTYPGLGLDQRRAGVDKVAK